MQDLKKLLPELVPTTTTTNRLRKKRTRRPLFSSQTSTERKGKGVMQMHSHHQGTLARNDISTVFSLLFKAKKIFFSPFLSLLGTEEKGWTFDYLPKVF
jgi:hypothetical protein